MNLMERSGQIEDESERRTEYKDTMGGAKLKTQYGHSKNKKRRT